ncbi:MAG: hypothetical protein Q8L52_00915 [bacterium]|nr:hypothetical protein [bacterium]
MTNGMEDNMNKPEPTKIVQIDRVVEAQAKMKEILDRNNRSRFKLTHEIKNGAAFKALHEPKIENLDD